MKKIIFAILAVSQIISAQKKTKPPIGVISSSASIAQFYEKTELDALPKNQLIILYIERIKVLVNALPYIALTPRVGVTTEELGIPQNSDSKRYLLDQKENIKTFLKNDIEFQKNMTPYSDTDNLVTAILFYENILKELYLLSQ